MKYVLGLFFLLLGLACSPTQPLPAPTSEALLGDGNLPKSIITIEMGQMPETEASPEAPATATPPPPTLPFSLNTPTPYTGVFLGAPTAINADGQVIVPPTIPAIPFAANAGGNIPPFNAPNVPAGQVALANCNLPLASAFSASTQGLGCPTNSGLQITLVTQRFERGRMFWRDTGQIMLISDGGVFWRERDGWNESLPVDDPALVPPAGLLQPVRGFGLLWRNNPNYRETLGWALGPEFSISSTWQDFEGGTLFIGENNQIYALPNGNSGLILSP